MSSSIIIRDLETCDLGEVLELLSHLTSAPALSQEELEQLHARRVLAGVRTRVAVSSTTQKILGTASLIVEPKFTRGGKCVGHVEDVVTHPDCRGQGIGRELLSSLVEVARASDCYKVVLNCTDDMVAYYSKAGFRKCENQMRMSILPQ
ncbi:putative glucose 6-phosphate N-acetyltransferase [Leishmania major strain Friedlin]|uniref:Glucosamine 6-phosphate N-acetyltransferase n=1 Tax=Leishmania major TaxID=5664 RepID=Q4Q7W1_LEIMA|nr:putative glucose 6-phosphate N-acetyltransferase [Leishmania major strain Friedlin]CAG9577425.1 glucosamine_6-phosphate_n-acetyltransferase_-_putative [Leishmania major strain Friedlin]CAJ05759.1 putative glucose 6-phosphate N-acetyltransferase [Leishmania major strain Friedlin]|eukprot:XP_001684587.1 putative glucose 6-phosphate N-acetyltransferase [Leishmania major strain Friedlin]